MVASDYESQDSYSEYGVDHTQFAEDRAAAVSRDDLADDSEARQYQDVDFWVAEESEEVLV